MNRPTHTLNPNTGREIQINGVRFWNLLKRGFKYDEKLNRLYVEPSQAWIQVRREIESLVRQTIAGGYDEVRSQVENVITHQ